jgi:hypothetical protein
MVWVFSATPRPLSPRERPGTYCIGGWVGLRAGLDGYGKSRPPTGIRSPYRPALASRCTDYDIPAQQYTKRIAVFPLFPLQQASSQHNLYDIYLLLCVQC